MFLGANKQASEQSLCKTNSFNRNVTVNKGFNPFVKEADDNVKNIFLELADDERDDVIAITLPQKGQSSVMNKPMICKDKSAISNFSLNVMTGTEAFQNPNPLKFKKEESFAKVKVERMDSNDDTTNDKSHRAVLTLSKKSSSAFLDSGDRYIRRQTRSFTKPGYNYSQAVEFILEDEDKMSGENQENDSKESNSQSDEEQEEQPTRAQKNIKNLRAQAAGNKSTKSSTPLGVSIRRHRKKSKKQLEILNSHFSMDKEWTLELVERLAADLDLEKDQVYKWNWDKRKRLRKKLEKEGKLRTSSKHKRQRTH